MTQSKFGPDIINNKRRIVHYSIFGATLFVLFILLFILNTLYPTYIDDWDYSFVYYTNNKLNSIFDIIPSMMKHYTMWGGRLVVHSLLQEFLYFGPFWADIFNSLMFVLYLILIYKISNFGNKINPFLIPVAFLLTWFFQADLGETILWMTGSANYLWGTTMLLAFLYPYYIYYSKTFDDCASPPNKTNNVYSFLFLIAGLIAGWTNENMVVAIGFLIVVFLFLIWRKTKKINLWSLTGLIGFGIGAILMFIAPGNFKRYKIELGLRGITDGKPTINYYLENLTTLLDGISQYLLILIAIYILLFIICLFIKDSKKKKQTLIISTLFFIASFIATFAMSASPVFMPRTWFGIITLLVVAIVVLLANLNFSKKKIFVPVSLCLIIGIIFFVKTYSEGRAELVKIRTIVDEREAEVNKQKAEGREDIILHISRFEKRDDLVVPKMYDFPEDPEHWMFKAYAHYHEVQTVRVIEDK